MFCLRDASQQARFLLLLWLVRGLLVVGGVGVCVCAGSCGRGAIPWASVACLWMGFEGWLFGGLTLLGPPSISLSAAFFVP